MFVDVILPLALANAYTYHIPAEIEEQVAFGMRLIVPLGAKKIYTGIALKVHDTPPEMVEPKDVLMVLDSTPAITEKQLELWKWIASYYQCTLGEIMKAALPSGLKLESETEVSIVEDFESEHPLKPKEQEALDYLSGQKKPTPIDELGKNIGIKNCLPIVKNLMEMGAVSVEEAVREKVKPKVEQYISLAPELTDEEKLHSVFDGLGKAQKQLKLLMCYLTESHFLSQSGQVKEITKKELIEKSGCNAAVVKSMVDKKIFVLYEKQIGRTTFNSDLHSDPANMLSDVQQSAYASIVEQFSKKQTVLLHGVTSSGKTEIYIHLIKDVIKTGKQALFLLPEIALTTQITMRLRKVFGSQLCVYHSKFSDAERVEIWQNMLKGEHCQVVLGVRSSVLLPFNDLGLVVVDEEHENSYKQVDPAPRYHARDAAIVLAGQMRAKVLLGSATPCIETYFNAKTGKYGLVELNTRYEGVQLPEIIVADIKEAVRRKEMQLHFTPELVKEMAEAFRNNEQVILFQNRRGYSPYIQCSSCGYVPRCKNCDVSLTYHKFSNLLSCHYCGYTYPMMQTCPACGNPTIGTRGFGTEKIEDEVNQIFPDVKVARLDLDVAKSRKNFEAIITDFGNGKTDVLVGTQMISKGLDFERVRVVGILNADSMLSVPDFRANERAFQLMAQVSGRAGRRGKRGVVVIQTSQPEHPIIKQVQDNNYLQLYNEQLEERDLFHYPPYFRITHIYIKGKDETNVEHAAFELAASLRTTFAGRVYGPDKPSVTRVNNFHIRKIVLKLERGIDLAKAKELTQIAINGVKASGNHKSIVFYADVDPA